MPQYRSSRGAINEHGISERAQILFKHLVEDYLHSGQPVGSIRLAETSGLDLSSATIRSIMVDLENQGLVRSPHTSAGRLPTQIGLRFFVDSLISVQPLEERAYQLLKQSLAENLSPHELVDSASQLLSEISHLVGLVTTPGPEQVELRQIEFLKLVGKQVLVILVVNTKEVQNRVIETEKIYSEIELRQAANYINQEFSGKSLNEIRRGVVDSMKEDQVRMKDMLQAALDITSKTIQPEETHDFVLSGERNLVELMSSSEEIRDILDVLSSKSAIIHLLDECIGSEGVQLFIGEESGYDLFGDYSIITSQYRVDGKIAGVLGVVGPTRMSYQRLIPLVDITARLLGNAMDHGRVQSSVY